MLKISSYADGGNVSYQTPPTGKRTSRTTVSNTIYKNQHKDNFDCADAEDNERYESEVLSL